MSKSKLTTLREVKAMAILCSGKHLDSMGKTLELIKPTLASALEKAHEQQLIFDPAQLNKRDLYCLNEINRQKIDEHYGQHHKLLLNALLITTYSTIEHTLATLARVIYKNQNKKPKEKLYLKDTLATLRDIHITLDETLVSKLHTLRTVRNILAHSRGEWLHQKPENLETIFEATPHITKGTYGLLDIAEAYLDESILLAENMLNSIIKTIDTLIGESNIYPEHQVDEAGGMMAL